MDAALASFVLYRAVFVEYDIRDKSFTLPRQHSMFHYTRGIKQFGSPNGLCSSITESKHIAAIKKPWRASSKNNALLEILETNVRLSKISALRVEFGHRGMLRGDVLTAAKIEMGLLEEEDYVPREVTHIAEPVDIDDEDDVDGDDGPHSGYHTTLASKPGMFITIFYTYTHSFYRMYLGSR